MEKQYTSQVEKQYTSQVEEQCTSQVEEQYISQVEEQYTSQVEEQYTMPVLHDTGATLQNYGSLIWSFNTHWNWVCLDSWNILYWHQFFSIYQI